MSGYNEAINSSEELKKYCNISLEKPISGAQIIEAISLV